MKVRNMESSKGNKIANQFIIDGYEFGANGGNEKIYIKRFQSYSSLIVEVRAGQVYLDEDYWDYSKTTGKYRNMFLGETKAETQKKIDSGEYILTNLN